MNVVPHGQPKVAQTIYPSKNISSLSSPKYMSIEYMRGLAAFFVAYGHLTYGFFDKNYLVLDVGPRAAEIVATGLNDIPALWKIIPNSGVWVNLFFLISGFVIELSSRRVKPAGFLVQRLLRIYPVFWVGFAIQLLISLLVLHKTIPGAAAYNFFLFNDSSFVGVSWTLVFEVNFYAFIFISAIFRVSLERRLIFLQAIFWIFLAVDRAHIGLNYELKVFVLSNSFYLSWMSIGTTLYYLFNDSNVSNERRNFYILLTQSFMVFLQFSMLTLSPTGGQMFQQSYAIWYPEAYGIFLTLLLFDKYIGRMSVLGFLGKISYPLYCIHYPLGWGLHFIFIRYCRLSPLESLCVVLPVVLFVSWGVNRLVEGPAQRLGKRLTASLRTASSRVEVAVLR